MILGYIQSIFISIQNIFYFYSKYFLFLFKNFYLFKKIYDLFQKIYDLEIKYKMKRKRFSPKAEMMSQFWEKAEYIPRGRRRQHKQLIENGIDVSYSYFKKHAKTNLVTKTIKTGGCNCRFDNLMDSLEERATLYMNQNNTLSLDEKIFSPKQFADSKVVVPATHRGMITGRFRKPTETFVNLECVISPSGVVTYEILDHASKQEDFDMFIQKLIQSLTPSDTPQYVLMDNGSFHVITQETEDLLKQYNYNLVRNPPLGCFLNPIEEFFSQLAKRVENYLNEVGVVNQSALCEAIHAGIDQGWEPEKLSSLFARAGIPYSAVEETEVMDFEFGYDGNFIFY